MRANKSADSFHVKRSDRQLVCVAAAVAEQEYQTVRVREADSGRSVQITFLETHVVGQGSFGTVTRAELLGETEEERGVVALKRTRQDKRFKCREMQIVSAVSHPNVVKLRYFWYEADDGTDDLCLNLMFEYMVRSDSCGLPWSPHLTKLERFCGVLRSPKRFTASTRRS